MRTLPLLENRKSGGDKVEDFLGKGDYQPTGQGQEPLRTLGGIMALEGQTDLYDTPAQQNHTNGTNQGENECRKVVYHSERIVTGCEGCGGKAAGAQYYSGIAGKSKASLFTKRQSIGGFVVLFTVRQRTNFFRNLFRSIPPISCKFLWFEKILRFQQFEILILVRGIIEIVCGVLRLCVVVGRSAAILC